MVDIPKETEVSVVNNARRESTALSRKIRPQLAQAPIEMFLYKTGIILLVDAISY